MSEQENVRTVIDAYSSFKTGDIEGVLKVLTEDVEWITPGPPELMPIAWKTPWPAAGCGILFYAE